MQFFANLNNTVFTKVPGEAAPGLSHRHDRTHVLRFVARTNHRPLAQRRHLPADSPTKSKDPATGWSDAKTVSVVRCPRIDNRRCIEPMLRQFQLRGEILHDMGLRLAAGRHTGAGRTKRFSQRVSALRPRGQTVRRRRCQTGL